uniref:Retrovirus-related Pol polyprotein from transposon TNT 1-94 n=1 Tax=Cannabis sativa TaxID=3483 RepID=A0A803PPJ1_CANSA
MASLIHVQEGAQKNGGSDYVVPIWINLREYYTSLNRAKISQYKTLLCNTKMLLLNIKSIIDTLASIGHSTTSQDHIEAIFNGLPAEYNIFITSINTRTDAYNVAKIESTQLGHFLSVSRDSAPPSTGLFGNFRGGNASANIAEMQAYYATPKVVNDPNWYPDSGATHLLTPNEHNLASSSTYNGDQHVHVGNDSQMYVAPIGGSSNHEVDASLPAQPQSSATNSITESAATSIARATVIVPALELVVALANQHIVKQPSQIASDPIVNDHPMKTRGKSRI